MNNRLLILTITLLILIISACSVTKNDYQTQKAKSFKGHSTGNYSFEKISNNSETKTEDIQIEDEGTEKETALFIKKKATKITKFQKKKALNKKKINSLNTIIDLLENSKIIKRIAEEEEENLEFISEKKKVEKLGLAGFITSLIPSLSLLLAIAIPGSAAAMTLWAYISLLLTGVVALVFGLVSLSRIKKNPEKYKGKEFAITSIIIGALSLLAWFIASLALLLVLLLI